MYNIFCTNRNNLQIYTKLFSEGVGIFLKIYFTFL